MNSKESVLIDDTRSTMVKQSDATKIDVAANVMLVLVANNLNTEKLRLVQVICRANNRINLASLIQLLADFIAVEALAVGTLQIKVV